MNFKHLLLKIMKLTFYGIFLQCLILNFLFASEMKAQEQNSVKEVFISLKLQNASLSDTFKEIENQTNFTFSYDLRHLENKLLITLDAKNQSVADILLKISEKAGLKFKQVNNNINVENISAGDGQAEKVEIIIQSRNVNGTVTSFEDEEPIPGVNVVEKGTTNGTVTNVEGEYNITVSDGATLVFSSVGYTTEEVLVGNRSVIDLVMNQDIKQLQELVVVGYGTQKKSDIVGSVASVSTERLEQNANPNLFQAMQASAPGINITRGSGDPGTNGSIQIRGINSISASNEPLIVVDGIPYAGNIRDINPNDIASVEILKDASAAAIYGSRAASGVILITTKRGGGSGTVISVNTSWSIQNEAVEYELMNPQEFYQFRREAHRAEGDITGNETDDEIAPIIFEVNELKSWERGESVNWMDEMLNRNALRQDYQISVNTGNEDISNYFSLSYVEEEGLQKTTGFSRVTAKNNLELLSIAPWLKLGNNLLFSYNDFDRMVFGINNQPAFYRLSPFSRIYADDGSYERFPQANDELLINPLAEIELSSRENSFTNLFNNIYFEVAPEFLKGFTYRMNFGTTLRYTKQAIYWPRGTWLGDANNGLAEVENSRVWDFTWENIVKYNKTFGRHQIDFTGLYSRQSHDFERTVTGASGFVTDDLLWYNPNAGSNPILPQVGGFPKNEWDLVSYMIRMNYSFNEKYYLTATARRDGYSGFAANKKYGNFPSVAVAWRLSSEPFMSSFGWMDDLKVRASYGTVGNQAVGTYRSLAQLRDAPHVFGETVVGGVKIISLRNDDLGWERATTLNIGADFSAINGRISGSLDYYNTMTSDLLLSREIPKITGQDDILFNIGEVKNTGFELALNTIPVTAGDFNWKLGINFSANRNEIVDLYGDQQDDIQNRWFIGEPLNVIYDFAFAGIWQTGQEDEIAESATPNREPGDARIVDQNNDGVLDAADQVIVGVQQPKWLGGLNSTFSYKNLSLNVFVQTVQGIDRRYREEGTSARFNKAPYDYWTPENPSNTWIRPHILSPASPLGSIDVYDASFTRIKDITLAYNLPQELTGKLGLNTTRVYLNFHDYFTFTDFPFVDPESAAYARISIPKYVLLGLNLSF